MLWEMGVFFAPGSKIKNSRKLENQKFIEFFRGRPRGGDNFTSIFQVLQTLYSKRQNHPLLP